MKKLAAAIVAFCFVLAVVNIGLAMDSMKIEGKVSKIEGEYVFIKDYDGKVHKLHTDDSTKKTGDIKAGAEVEAEATDMGHAKSIKVMGDMDMKGDMKK